MWLAALFIRRLAGNFRRDNAMSKQDRNTQREQDRQNLEAADLATNKPEHERDPQRPAAGQPKRDSTAKPVARERDSVKGQPGAAGSSGSDVDDLQRQDDALK
jgi:hypothetical protein